MLLIYVLSGAACGTSVHMWPQDAHGCFEILPLQACARSEVPLNIASFVVLFVSFCSNPPAMTLAVCAFSYAFHSSGLPGPSFFCTHWQVFRSLLSFPSLHSASRISVTPNNISCPLIPATVRLHRAKQSPHPGVDCTFLLFFLVFGMKFWAPKGRRCM